LLDYADGDHPQITRITQISFGSWRTAGRSNDVRALAQHRRSIPLSYASDSADRRTASQTDGLPELSETDRCSGGIFKVFANPTKRPAAECACAMATIIDKIESA
jgi:hypothetical protein